MRCKFDIKCTDIPFREKDGGTDALTFGYLLCTYNVRKSSQESVSAQQIPDIFYEINLILS